MAELGFSARNLEKLEKMRNNAKHRHIHDTKHQVFRNNAKHRRIHDITSRFS
jgi:hypothetical protein